MFIGFFIAFFWDGAWLTFIITILKQVLQYLIKPAWSGSAIITGILTMGFNAFQNPDGFINSTLVNGIDLVSGVLPSTPSQFQIGSMLNEFYQVIPFGQAELSDIFQGITSISAAYLGVKAIKMVPFS